MVLSTGSIRHKERTRGSSAAARTESLPPLECPKPIDRVGRFAVAADRTNKVDAVGVRDFLHQWILLCPVNDIADDIE